jgi:purine-binding chemotaxis protein CheW
MTMPLPRRTASLADRLRTFRYHPDEDVSALMRLLPPPGDAPQELPLEQAVREYLSFELGETTYLVPLGSMMEILRAQRLVEIPRAEPPLLGVLDLRGTVTPVYDLGLRLALRDRIRRVAGPEEACDALPREARILVTRTPTGPAGLWVDRVRDVMRLAPASFQPRVEAGGAVVGLAPSATGDLRLLDLEAALR